jgi:hypothetical protein
MLMVQYSINKKYGSYLKYLKYGDFTLIEHSERINIFLGSRHGPVRCYTQLQEHNEEIISPFFYSGK